MAIGQRRASIDSIQLLKDWSATLAFIDTGLIVALGALVQAGPPPGGERWLVASIVLFMMSLIVSLNVLGCLPDIAQRFGTQEEPEGSLYRETNRFGIPHGVLACLQHAMPIGALATLVPLLLKRISQDIGG